MSLFSRIATKGVVTLPEGREIPWKALGIWFLCFLPAILIFLNNNSVVALRHERRVLTGISHGSGFEYVSSIAPGWVEGVAMSIPDTLVLENGRPLSIQEIRSPDVISKGNGRFYPLADRVVFSSSDNSDPRTNGRVYEIDGILKFPRTVSWAFYSLAACATLAFIVLYRERLKFIFGNPPLYAPLLLLAALFLMARLWFFADYPVPGIYRDTASYYNALIERVDAGQWPMFTIRPPLFPMLLKYTYVFVDRVTAVIALQNALSIAAAAFLVYAVHRVKPAFSIPAAIAMAGWIAGSGPLVHDTSLLSESLYATMLVFSFGLLLLGIYRERPLVLGLASAAMAAVILTRPAGMFLIVIYLMVLAFFLWMRYSRRKIAAFVIPFPALILSLCLYNYLTAGVFAVTAFGGANLAGATLIYWEQDNGYPERINQSIAKVQASMEKRDEYMETIRSYSNPYEIVRVLKKGYGAPQYPLAMNLDVGDAIAGTADKRPASRSQYDDELHVMDGNAATIDKWLRRISLDAIKKHPDLYLKGVSVMALCFCRQIDYDEDFRFYIKRRVQLLNADKRTWWSTPAITKEYAGPVTMDGVSVTGSGFDAQIDVKPTFLFRLYQAVHVVRTYIFAHLLWNVVPVAIFLISTVMLIRSRARSKAAFFIFVITSAVIGAGLIVNLAESGCMQRYSYPMEFTYYLALALSPLMFMKDERG